MRGRGGGEGIVEREEGKEVALLMWRRESRRKGGNVEERKGKESGLFVMGRTGGGGMRIDGGILHKVE